MAKQALNYAKHNNAQFLDSLFEFLRIPSVSTLPEHQTDIQKAAHWLEKFCREIKLENVQLVKTSGNPIVYADWLHAKNKPTVLVYGHYDVQPPDPIKEWHTPPFEPTIKKDRLWGRGTSDSKCQHFVFLAAVASFLKTNKSLPINIKFAIEGEEEIGSRHFAEGLKNHRHLFNHDIALIIDFGMPSTKIPAIGYGLRGIVYTEVAISGPKQDLHSGVFGGVIDNPAIVLSRIINQLKDPKNRITIPGFYDDVASVTKSEADLLALYPKNETQVKKLAGVAALIGEPGLKQFEQRKTRPSLDVNGLISGFTGAGAKTIIPASATAKISMRLVPNQDPQKIFTLFKKHVTSLAPKTVKVKITEIGHGEPAVITNYRDPKIQSIKAALKDTFGVEPFFNRSGGSIPAAGHIQKLYHTPLAIIGFSPPDDNIHSPNENFYLPNFAKGIEAAIRMLEEIGK